MDAHAQHINVHLIKIKWSNDFIDIQMMESACVCYHEVYEEN